MGYKEWVTWNEHNVLWLPAEYRSQAAAWQNESPPTPSLALPLPSLSPVASVAIGCRSGRVVIIGFSEQPPLR